MRIYGLILVLACVASTALSQDFETAASGQTRSVVNEDLGRACILPSSARLRFKRTVKPAAIPQQFSLFVGSGWKESRLQKREILLANLLTPTANLTQSETLQQLDVRRPVGEDNFAEVGSTGSQADLSDLQIQSIIDKYYRSMEAPIVSAETVFVVYLDPSTGSSLAAMSGGKHYVAYHNGFYSSGARLRYVVAPFQDDQAAAAQNALSAFLSAAFDPGCEQ